MHHRISRRTWLRGVGALGLAGASGAVYAGRIEPGWIAVEALSLPLARLDAAFEGYRIVQLSDIHIDGVYMDQPRLAAIVGEVNAQRPDLVVITGDFVSEPLHPTMATIFSALAGLDAPDGVCAVLGNHDHWSNPDRVRGLLRDQGITELPDAVHTIRRGAAMLHIAGMDDLWTYPGRAPSLSIHQSRLHDLVTRMPEAGAAVLLVHEPDFADVTVTTRRFALQLSGHSHGGQIRVPFGGAILLPPLGEIYDAGLYQVGDLLHYTNRGVGMLAPRVRFNCRPEITVITLKMPEGATPSASARRPAPSRPWWDEYCSNMSRRRLF